MPAAHDPTGAPPPRPGPRVSSFGIVVVLFVVMLLVTVGTLATLGIRSASDDVDRPPTRTTAPTVPAPQTPTLTTLPLIEP